MILEASVPETERHRRNLILGLSASAGSHDLHYGAFILAAARIKRLLPPAPALALEIDAAIQALPSREEPVRLLEREEVPVAEAIAGIARALEATCGSLHFIAHDLILAVSAMSALQELGGRIDASMAEGLRANIAGLSEAPPGIFHGYGFAEVRAREAASTGPPMADPDPARLMMGLLRGIPRTYLGFGFRAQEYHVLTHAHALEWLRRHGYHECYLRASGPWRMRMELLDGIRNPDPAGLRPAEAAPFHPGDAAFWSKLDGRNGDRHAFKAILAWLELRKWGALGEADAAFLLERKFPWWFSPAPDEF